MSTYLPHAFHLCDIQGHASEHTGSRSFCDRYEYDWWVGWTIPSFNIPKPRENDSNLNQGGVIVILADLRDESRHSGYG